MARRFSRRTFVTTGAAAGVALASGVLTQWAMGDDDDEPVVPLGPTPVGSPVADPPPVDQEVNGYLAVAPRTLRAGQQEQISLAIFNAGNPVTSTVRAVLHQEDVFFASAEARVAGRGVLSLAVPKVPAGEYTLRISGKGFADSVALQVQDSALLFIETDKPIYKPGQTLHMRVLALDPGLRPLPGEAVVDVLDAQGIKVFRTTVVLDDFGMAHVDLPLSSEPNLGVWKARVEAGDARGEVDVRVERYTLPKYEVRLDLEREWTLVTEPIHGIVTAEYSFGKPVVGEVEIVALRYVGIWEEYARLNLQLGASGLAFEVPAPEYSTGSPDGGGLGAVRLDVTVREQGTGYSETTNQLVSVAAAPVVLRIIPESTTFKPGLPFGLLVVAETPDQQPLDADVTLSFTWIDQDLEYFSDERRTVTVFGGLARLEVTPPAEAASVSVEASGPENAWTFLSLLAGYSPSGAFIQLSQQDPGPLRVGEVAQFSVAATREATSFFYEVLGRGTVVYSGYTREPQINVTLTPQMAPQARLLVYQILSNGEVAADYLPFSVEGSYPQTVTVELGTDEVRPGDALEALVQTQGPARVGLAAVDRSVFILAENRLNLQQVFAELERLFQEPQAELHSAEPGFAEFAPMNDPFAPITIPGAQELFERAGVVVLTNRRVPAGKELQPAWLAEGGAGDDDAVMAAAEPVATPAAGSAPPSDEYTKSGLAEVQRVRQFFPETWVWSTFDTDADGRGTQQLNAPDSITTWMFRAVALSQEHGLGIGEAELRVFQPFFVQIDLPYSAIRGEELPAQVALYNYTSTAQEFLVELEPAGWFEPLGALDQTVTVGPNEVGAASFPLRPLALGVQPLRVTARSGEAADALIKELLVEPEGVVREEVENLTLPAGESREASLEIPFDAIDGSGRALLAISGNILSQTIDGLESLLQMPYGCGEQNMLLFAPDVFITRYLEETGQSKPEVIAKAELLMLTGYQRELTYRRSDGSFSAFGNSDAEGSLWLTAFVLKTFAQAQGMIHIDESVLTSAADWIRSHQNPDGSFTPVGFVHHEDMLGGLTGIPALTAYIAVALTEAGDAGSAGRAIGYLEEQLPRLNDPYAVALTTYALALAGSGQAGAAQTALMALAKEDENGLYWGEELRISSDIWGGDRSATIETTGYAALALLALDDPLTAAQAVRWLSAQRNAFGGYGSTQDTVVALQALTSAAIHSRADTDAIISLQAGDWSHEVVVNAENADVLQVIELPLGAPLRLSASGSGQVLAQVVRRYNLPEVLTLPEEIFSLDVQYDAEEIEVDDLLTISATIRFTPPETIAAGMVVLDIAVPTGFAPEAATIDALLASQPKLKRWDLAGRKVIFYIDDLRPGESLSLEFQARALYPVRAQPVTSQVYSYYRPEWKREQLGVAVAVAV